VRWSAILVNVALRLSILYFLGEGLLFSDDPRFAGKAIPVRNAIIVLTFSLLFPVLHRWTERWSHYPFWLDNLYLSIFWLDMAGNSFNLYDRYYYFDLVPHFHGPAALALVLLAGFGLQWLAALGTAHIVHTLLEIQEYYTDVLLGTHNVRGVEDTINDLAAGLVGMMVYLGLYALCRQLRRPRRDRPS
jgi:hypothetical protein